MKKSTGSATTAEAGAPFVNMRFRVEIDGLQGTGATEVVFPEARLALSGRGRPAVRYGPLTLVRGLTRSAEWYDWWDRCRSARGVLQKTVAVVLLDGSGADAHRWEFTGARPLAYTVSSLDARGHEALLESIELTVTGFKAHFAD